MATVTDRPQFDLPNILWFFGAFTAVAASDAVISDVHPTARGVWILLASLGFLAAFAALAAGLLRAGWRVPGGVLAAMAVTFVAPATLAFERLIGVWRINPNINPFQEYEGPALGLVLAIALAGVIAFVLVRFHFILAIVVVATFAAAQLLLPVVVARPNVADHATAFVVVGGALIVAGLALDLREARQAAFWWHFFGLATLAIGLGYHAFRQHAWGWVLIFVVGTIVLLLGASLRRATWGVFGVAGFYAPIAHYLDVWLGHLGVAFALAAVGLGFVAMGIGARVFGDSWPSFRRRPSLP